MVSFTLLMKHLQGFIIKGENHSIFIQNLNDNARLLAHTTSNEDFFLIWGERL